MVRHYNALTRQKEKRQEMTLNEPLRFASDGFSVCIRTGNSGRRLIDLSLPDDFYAIRILLPMISATSVRPLGPLYPVALDCAADR